MNVGRYPVRLIIAILLANSTLATMSTDLYVPSMPDLPDFFGTTAEMVQLTLVINALGFGLAQLFIGPLADRFGRRPVFIVGVSAFCLFSVGCALAQSIEQLILARLLHGAAAAAEAVLVVAIISDLFDGQARVRVFAIYGMLFAIAPGVAPIIGGYVHYAFGWRANFALLAIAGALLALLAWRFLPETAGEQRHSLNITAIAGRYLTLLRNRAFMRYTLMMALLLGIIYSFIIEAPFIIIDLYGIPVQHYGYYHLLMVAAYVLGSLATTWLTKRVSIERLVAAGFIALLVGAAVMLGREFVPGSALGSFVVAISIMFFALAPLWAVFPARAMTVANTGAGTASATLGMVEMLGGGLIAALTSVFHDGTTRPLALVLAAAAGVLIVFHMFSGRGDPTSEK
jgi:DHA1 family bicyclomycin/chloramphenicol resistance-like MFS transporter